MAENDDEQPRLFARVGTVEGRFSTFELTKDSMV